MAIVNTAAKNGTLDFESLSINCDNDVKLTC